MDLKLCTASRGEIKVFPFFLEPCCGRQVCSEAFRTGCPLYACTLCNISGASVVDAELPSALGQITPHPTPTTNCGKPTPYHLI